MTALLRKRGWRCALALSILFCLGAALLFGQDEEGAQKKSKVSWLDAMLSPGPVSAAHAAVENDSGCAACHEGRKGLKNSLCLDCHKEIRERMRQKAGFHGKIKGACHSCHTEHKGRGQKIVELDRTLFNHDTALFRVTGKHHDLECEACHAVKKKQRKVQDLYFIGLPRTCSGCHDDPHAGQFDKECDDCHLDHGWTAEDLLFDHQTMSRYPLDGRHREVACAKCHEEMKRFKPLETTCVTCHEDPHNGQFASDKTCTTCHGTSGWKGRFLDFDHGRDSTFGLTGAHKDLDCAKCHDKGRWRGAKSECAACHQDPHQGQFEPEKACVDCHATRGWTGAFLQFDHATDSAYPLTGLHELVACTACHENGVYRPRKAECAACHDDPHAGRLEGACDRCHVTEGFEGKHVAFDHDRQTEFGLSGLHANKKCTDCHDDLSFTVSGSTCSTCHAEAAAFYAGTLFVDLVPPKPDAMHRLVKCTDCHQPEDPKAAAYLVRPRCVSCHNDDYGAYLSQCIGLVAARRQRLFAEGAVPDDAKTGAVFDAIDRFSAHNFVYAQKLLDALEKK